MLPATTPQKAEPTPTMTTPLRVTRKVMSAASRCDSSRSAAPLKPAQDALLLDNSEMTVETSVKQVLDWWQDKQPFSPV